MVNPINHLINSHVNAYLMSNGWGYKGENPLSIVKCFNCEKSSFQKNESVKEVQSLFRYTVYIFNIYI